MRTSPTFNRANTLYELLQVVAQEAPIRGSDVYTKDELFESIVKALWLDIQIDGITRTGDLRRTTMSLYGLPRRPCVDWMILEAFAQLKPLRDWPRTREEWLTDMTYQEFCQWVKRCRMAHPKAPEPARFIELVLMSLREHLKT